MNRGSRFRRAGSAEPPRGFNEAPIHESGKSPISTNKLWKPVVLQ